MKRRDRVLKALNFEQTDRVPMDLGGMRSSSISCFKYSELRNYLGLEPRLPLIYDDYQMLAIPEKDVLDSLDCDVVFYDGKYSNAFDERQKFKYYDFNGRLEAMVENPDSYKVVENGTIIKDGKSMPSGSTVFDDPHGGNAFDLDNVYKEPLDEVKRNLESKRLSEREIEELAIGCRKIRETTDRAIFLNGFELPLAFPGGIANGTMLCLLEPGYMKDYHEIKAGFCASQMEKVIEATKENIDIVLTGNQDLGTQNTTIVSPDIVREIYMPYFKTVNDAVHGATDSVKTFLHSCGAIYDIIEDVIGAGFDILNPVQWTAGGHSYREWKDKARKRITLWGGGANSQHTLPRGTLDEIRKQVAEVVKYMKEDGGFIFCNIHNLTAEVGPEKIKALYDTAAKS